MLATDTDENSLKHSVKAYAKGAKMLFPPISKQHFGANNTAINETETRPNRFRGALDLVITHFYSFADLEISKTRKLFG